MADRPSDLGRNRAIFTLLFVCLAARLVFFLLVQPWDSHVETEILLRDDALGYHSLALNLFSDHGFYPAEGVQDPLRPPVYPLLVGFIYALFGPQPWLVLLLHAILDTVSCALIFKIVARTIGTRAGLWTAAFYALDPFLILYSNMLLSEIPFIFLCVLATYLLLPVWSRDRASANLLAVGISGLCFGLATLTRPSLTYLPIIILVVMFLARGAPLRRIARTGMVFTVVFLITISTWYTRNYIAYGVPSLSVVMEYNLLYDKIVARREAARNGITWRQAQQQLRTEVDSLIIEDGGDPQVMSLFELAPYWRKLSIAYIRTDPVGYGFLYARSVVLSFANLATGSFGRVLRIQNESPRLQVKEYDNPVKLAQDWFQRKSPGEMLIGLWIAIWHLVSYACLALGLVRAWSLRNNPFVVFTLLTALYLIAISAVGGLARYRLPALPFYLPFIGLGATWLWTLTQRMPRVRSGRHI